MTILNKTSFFCDMKFVNLFIPVVFLLFSNLSKTTAQTQFSGWVASFNSFKVGRELSIHLDVQARSTDKVENLSAFLFRPGINWHFRHNMIASAGYGYILNRRNTNNITGYLPEHRIWEQFIVNHPLNFVAVSHRFRLEQRFISKAVTENNELKAEGNLFANRIRYFTRGVIPFNGKKGFQQGMFGALQNELFVNLGDKSAVNGKAFDQNRFYTAVGYRFSKKFDIETGYLNQYVSGRNKTFTNNHVIQLAGYLRL